MKAGSLVVCVDASLLRVDLKKLEKDKIYTVRDICSRLGETGVILEEIINIKFKNGEGAYKIDRFRELDAPTEISIEEILELELV